MPGRLRVQAARQVLPAEANGALDLGKEVFADSAADLPAVWDTSAGGSLGTGGAVATGGILGTGGGGMGGRGDFDAGSDAPAAGGGTAVGGAIAVGGAAQRGGASGGGGQPGSGGTTGGIPGTGGLTVLNRAGFQAAVTFTFDDNNTSQTSNYPQLRALGGHYTFYQVTDWSTASNAVWLTAKADGHEIGNHTTKHTSTPSATDIDGATTFITNRYGERPWTFAAPNGSTGYLSLLQSRFLVNR